MSTNEKPGLAVNEDEVERHVRETREQAKRANYPDRPTPIHGKAAQVEREPDENDDSKTRKPGSR